MRIEVDFVSAQKIMHFMSATEKRERKVNKIIVQKHKTTRKLRLKVKARSSKERSLFIYSTDIGPGDYDRKIDRGSVVAILLCTWRLIGID